MKTGDSTEYIKKLIAEGEHLHQDFKFEISDARKIAKSLSAFANTEGGRLLIGVKDNGKIAGVRSEEEAYMIDAAANVYCTPHPEVEMTAYTAEGRTVLIADVRPAEHKPVFAIDHDGKSYAYIRKADENILATAVHLKVWQQEQSERGTLIKLSGAEQVLMDMLDSDEDVDIKSFVRRSGVSRFSAIRILAKFVRFGVAEEVFHEHKFYWRRNRTL